MWLFFSFENEKHGSKRKKTILIFIKYECSYHSFDDEDKMHKIGYSFKNLLFLRWYVLRKLHPCINSYISIFEVSIRVLWLHFAYTSTAVYSLISWYERLRAFKCVHPIFKRNTIEIFPFSLTIWHWRNQIDDNKKTAENSFMCNKIFYK